MRASEVIERRHLDHILAQQLETAKQEVGDALHERNLQTNLQTEEHQHRSAERRTELESKWEQQFARHIEGMQSHAVQLSRPGCRLSVTSPSSLGSSPLLGRLVWCMAAWSSAK